MPKTALAAITIALCAALAGIAPAGELCATAEQAKQIQEFYAANPGTMPPIAATRLGMPEAVVVSGLGAEQAASAPGADFATIWAAMHAWQEATFMIMKGANVFEIRSAVGKGAPSKTSKYFNVEYTQPVRGHLRPDLYASIYAVVLPRKDGNAVRGVLFYGEDGASVFSVFISGDGPPPPAAEIAKFDEVMQLIRSRPAVCPQTSAAPELAPAQ